MIVLKPIKIIIERIVICEDVQRAFENDDIKMMYHLYKGKMEGLREALKYLGLESPQIKYLVEIERERRRNGGAISEC